MKNNQEKAQESTLKLERAIKVLILLCALNLINKSVLLYKINILISKYNKELPKDLIDRNKYIVGSYSSAMNLVRNVYDPIIYNFEDDLYDKPIDFIRDSYKAEPTNEYYYDIIKNALKNLNRNELVYSEKGKKPITLWQKVELDIRHNAQMQMVENAKKSGYDLWWLSSHANCSERCAKHQGKLVSLTLSSIDDTFFTGQIVDGIKVYSFTDIENQVDKYGYKNNIINGFNCRHTMYKYEKGGVRPKKYSENGVSKVRKLENAQREMERAIRRKKSAYETTKYIYPEQAKKLKQEIKTLTNQYKEFCNKYGLVREDYRIF